MIDWNQYAMGNHRIMCPACGRGDRDRNLGLTIEANGNGVCHCFRCAYTEHFHPGFGSRPMLNSQPRAKPNAPTKHEYLSEYGQALWAKCEPLSGEASAYLTARRCRIPPNDGDLRWHPSLKHPSGHIGPCMIALVTDALTGSALSLHRTWIQSNGHKAAIDAPRMLLGGHRKKGGVIRLWPDDAVTNGLGIAEGIETALSLAWAHSPVWACIDAGNLAALPPLFGLETLYVAVDNDAAGQNAALTCAQNFDEAGIGVFLTQQTANDLNDLLKEAA
ncbi:DUF7146 domain-containing protein [Paraburkholderia acidisoli]|uniref:Toprim domain-containing protein n=1 Tax=Paraburkholderia acidisoli TaxID=2571748 RepID=A0A7Z2GGL3_9BURK|nr:toprim domain-containing protein [Paraburkholderia acidisoli]QGZ61079.1 hypothetical protein FAZ98_04650 [Paraburkholderia acidisoli]